MTVSDLATLEQAILGQIAAASDEAALEAVRVAALGKKGSISALLSTLGKMSPEERKSQGAAINLAKDKVTEALSARREVLKSAALDARLASETIDVTLPVREPPAEAGRIHPLSQVMDELTAIFADMGFAIAEGPDIETDDYNFTKLNFPVGHPARDMQDTFYIHQHPDWLLRTHTSSVQARTMEQQKPPIRIICPGRVYRNETISARAHCFFHQTEGLYVDENVSFADLKQTLYFFVQEMFDKDIKVRFRPSYFPFTEPSAEMDITCRICGGSGCSVCKHTGWVEILGSGMVHPKMLENFGIDSNKYTGFAFGMGIERICQLKYRINDLRLYSQNDVRFLKQFTGAV